MGRADPPSLLDIAFCLLVSALVSLPAGALAGLLGASLASWQFLWPLSSESTKEICWLGSLLGVVPGGLAGLLVQFLEADRKWYSAVLASVLTSGFVAGFLLWVSLFMLKSAG
jgi:hypothetical protein